MDATEFYVLPLPILLGLLVTLVGIAGLLTILIKRTLRESYDDEDGMHIPLYDNTGVTSANAANHDITISK
jgi:hypothetical protein